MTREEPTPPLLRVVRGRPTEEELAALTALLLARLDGPTSADGTPRRSRWSRGSGVRRPLPAPGPGAWRAVIEGER